jgi:hypothetical protein
MAASFAPQPRRPATHAERPAGSWSRVPVWPSLRGFFAWRTSCVGYRTDAGVVIGVHSTVQRARNASIEKPSRRTVGAARRLHFEAVWLTDVLQALLFRRPSLPSSHLSASGGRPFLRWAQSSLLCGGFSRSLVPRGQSGRLCATEQCANGVPRDDRNDDVRHKDSENQQ